jgi:hypothetical protein
VAVDRVVQDLEAVENAICVVCFGASDGYFWCCAVVCGGERGVVVVDDVEFDDKVGE